MGLLLIGYCIFKLHKKSVKAVYINEYSKYLTDGQNYNKYTLLNIQKDKLKEKLLNLGISDYKSIERIYNHLEKACKATKITTPVPNLIQTIITTLLSTLSALFILFLQQSNATIFTKISYILIISMIVSFIYIGVKIRQDYIVSEIKKDHDLLRAFENLLLEMHLQEKQ